MKQLFLFLVLFNFLKTGFSQQTDSTRPSGHFSGAISVTNNGISFIPSFSLGKPAAIFNLSVGNEKLSFEPELRFSLEGKPWSFLFWWRYKLLTTNKFRVTLGAHPALNFRTEMVASNGGSKEVIATRRYVAGELSPHYLLSKNISVGLYYLYSRGIDSDAVRNTHFLTLNSTIAHIKLAGHIEARFTPQVFYLKQNASDGFFVTSAVTFSRQNFPLALSALANKSIRSNIAGSKNFIWNATLSYAFHKNYVEK